MNLTDVLGERAAASPHAPAVITADATYDYRALDRAVWRAAKWFAARGIAPGDVVAVRLENSALDLVAAYALARLGAVQISIRAREPAAARRAMYDRYAVRAILKANGEPAAGAIPVLKPDADWLAEGPDEADPALRSPGGDAGWKIVTSSGTTGTPKAVLQSHAGNIAWRKVGFAAIPVGPETRVFPVLELGFFGLRVCMDTLAAGGSVVLRALPAPGGAQELIEALEAHRINYLHLTPFHVHQLLEALPQDGPRLPQLMLRVGSMIVTAELREQIRRRLTPNLVVTFGISDLGAGTGLLSAAGEMHERFPGTIGVPTPGVEVEIVDEEDRPVPAGSVGRLRLRGPVMPSGYLHNPAASAKAFRGGWFYPGDLASRNAEGAHFLAGRADDLMNLDGIKILPAEIEAILLSHPAVAEAAAFALRSEMHQDIPAAAVVLRTPARRKDLLRWTRERMGKRAPRHILTMQALPRNAMGKPLRHELAARLRARLLAAR